MAGLVRDSLYPSSWVLSFVVLTRLVLAHEKVIIDLGVRQVEGIVNRLTPI